MKQNKLFVRKLLLILIIALLVLDVCPAMAQSDGQKKVIQFSGVIMNRDSTMGIPGAHIYVPGKRRGTSANPYGYFTFALLTGDTVAISAVGFSKKHIRIPFLEEDSYKIIVYLEEDTTFLDELEILPYPSEEMFKESILAMQLPNRDDLLYMDRNMDPNILALMARNMPMDGSLNYSYNLQMHHDYLFKQYTMVQGNPLTNPFAWAEFIKSLKKKK